MCCLFGLLDYGRVFSGKQKSTIISVLSVESEIRGTDATGIAYNNGSKLCVYKRPLAAHRLRYHIPDTARYIMGHTRLTTQGNEKRNYNNHPFQGNTVTGRFALAHNGILHNDMTLRKREKLPSTKIQTDSYIAVQLLERNNALDFKSLAEMAEKVEGSFAFTVLDNRDNMFIVKGSSPFSIVHFPREGFYMYASTEQILSSSVKRLGLEDLKGKHVPIDGGDILRIDKYGKIERAKFDYVETLFCGCFGGYGHYGGYGRFGEYDTGASARTSPFPNAPSFESDYLEELKMMAGYFGYSPDDIQAWHEEGYSCEEIEEAMYEAGC